MASSVDEIVCIRLGGGHIVTTRCLALLGLVVFGGSYGTYLWIYYFHFSVGILKYFPCFSGKIHAGKVG